MKTVSILLSTIALAAGTACGQVVFSEVHYHPVERADFQEDGTPALDLTDDVHEFVEVQNAGGSLVNLSGWSISGGVEFTFPSATTLAPGGFTVVAKNPARLAAVYGLAPATVLGPYAGQLSNHGDQLRLRDAGGATRDQMRYEPGFPWPNAADALGAQARFLGIDMAAYQYKGRSLQRVSATWPGNDPANWVASPLATGPTPGGPQAVTRVVPKPVVIGLSVVSTNGGAAIVRANEAAKITASFSAGGAPFGVSLEYFVDDPDNDFETRRWVAMANVGGDAFTATLPGLPDRSVVRYRIWANRGSGEELISPRDDDANQAAAWHGYFVTPVRAEPAYDLFISSSALGALSVDITQTPRRVTKADATGQPREVPYVPAQAPQWNGTRPAVFCAEGQVWDVQLRYHGGFTQRSVARGSYKIHFPRWHPFHGVTSLFETDKDWRGAEGEAIVAAAGLPAPGTRTVNLYINDRAPIARLEMGEYNGELLDAFHRRQQRLAPQHVREATGELYKAIGNIGNTGNNSEGPYTRADFAPIADNVGWSSLGRFSWTYSQQNHAWTGPAPLKALVDAMWAARGDSFLAPSINTAAARAWCQQNLDLDSTLTSLAVINWMGAWDDVAQNQYFWRRADGRWTRLPWDFDELMDNTRVAQSVFVGATGEQDPFFGTNWFKDTVLKCFRDEFRQRLWELNNSLLSPENLSVLGLTHAAAFAAQRQANVNAQLGLGEYFKPVRPVNVGPADGAAVAAGASLTTSPFSHPNGTHAATKWEIRHDDGNYAEPVFVVTSTTAKTSLAIPFEQLVYGQTYYWRTTYLDGQGHPSTVSAETSFVWGGTVALGSGGLVLSEILAANHGAVEHGGATPDYIELHNAGAGTAVLDGMTLTDDPRATAKFVFPAGTSLPPGGYLVIWCDHATVAPGLHSGFQLNAGGQTVLLMNGAAIVDCVTFGPQAPDYAIGRAGGNAGWTLVQPSPGADNVMVPLTGTAALRINEWMTEPARGTDWFELYNGAAQPVSLGGLCLTDKLSTPAKTRLPALSFISPGGFTKFLADDSSGANHCHFKLSSGGDSIFLLAADALTVLDRVTFGRQEANVSQGRLPDGGAAIVSFPLTNSPEHSNWRRAPVVVNEVLAHSTPPLEDTVELYNPTSAPVDISGWWLSDDVRTPRKYQIPAGTIVPANGYRVFYGGQFGGDFSLSSLGDEVVLSAAANGALTGYRSQVHFGASTDGVSFGRVPLVGVADEFWLMSARTFGVDQPGTVEEFRTGTGTANASALAGPVIINELRPAATGAGDALQYAEIQNITGGAVDLSGWVVRGGVQLTFAPGTGLAPGGYALLVAFDPADANALAAFRTAYQVPPVVPIFGPITSYLHPHGTRVELVRPEVNPSGRSFIMVDRVDYRDYVPWPHAAAGQSLQRLGRFQIGNDPANWTAAAPSPALDNAGQGPVVPGAPPAAISLAAATASVAENAGSVEITVQRAGETAGAVSVSYGTLSGTATADADFTAATGVVTLASGETTKTISIPILNDNAAEADETFTVFLFAPTGGATLGARTAETVTILDNDLAGGGAVAGEFQFVAPSSAASEASAGSHLVTIQRTGGSTGTVSVQVIQVLPNVQWPDATPGQDFAPVLPLTVTFGPGETAKNIAIPLLDDSEVELNERLRLSLVNADGGAVIGAASTHDIILSSDDVPPIMTPIKAAYTGLINEPFIAGGSGWITLETSSTGAVTGRLNANGLAYAIAGTFDAHGEFRRNLLPRTGGKATYRTLYLRLAADGSRVDGMLDDEPISAERNATGTAAAPVPARGRYTALLREADRTVGTLTLNIAANGSVRVTGTLGDGTPFTAASALSITDRMPLCSALYVRRAGFLVGAAQLSAASPRVLSGNFAWGHPAAGGGTLVRTMLALDGALFVPPAPGQRVLSGMTSASAALAHGHLAPEPPAIPVTISARDQFVVPTNPQRLSLQLNPRFGTLSGRFLHTDGRARTIRGVLVQRPAAEHPTMEGSFPDAVEPGTVRITP